MQVRGVEPAREDGIAFVGVEAAIVEIHILLLAAEQIDDVQATEVGVLQVAERFPEQGGVTGAIAIKQREAAFRFGFQGGFYDRQNRRDAAAGGHRQVSGFPRRVQIDVEVATGRHDLQSVAFFKLAIGEGGETATGHFLHRHTQVTVVDAGADGVGATYFLTVHVGTDDQMLALGETESVAQFRRNIESDGHRLAGFRPHLANF